MSEVTFDRAALLSESFGEWYRARPFQIAFALSVLVHAALITFVPGFRTPVVERPQVLTVRIEQAEEPRIPPEPRPRPAEPTRQKQPVALPQPPQFTPQQPERRLQEKPVTEVRPEIAPPPVPRLEQPEPLPQEPVARAELVPVRPSEQPRPKPLVQPSPQPAPEPPSVALIERAPAPDLERPALTLPPVARVEPRPQQPVTIARPEPVPAPAVSAPRPEPQALAPAPPLARPEPPAPVRAEPRVEPRIETVRPQPSPRPQAPLPAPAQVAAPQPPAVTSVAPPVASAALAPRAEDTARDDAAILQALTASFSQQVSSKIKRYQRYPMVAMRRGWEGTAEVLVRFDADGRVSDIVLGKSSGRDILDEEAINMVRRATPLPEAPQKLFGREIKVPIVFRLQDS